MALPINQTTRYSLAKIKKEPVLVVQFDGIPELLGSATAYKYIEIGEPGLVIGNSWVIGGRIPIGDQISAITFSSNFGNTTTSIDFKVDPDKGRGESVTSMTLAFLDTKANEVLAIVKNYEMLGRKCRVLLAPDPTDTVFPEDYVTIFRGIVESYDLPAGGVVFNVSHPDQKKRQNIYNQAETTLVSGISSGDTNFAAPAGEGVRFLTRILGADGTYDGSFLSYVRIDNEIIRYTGITPGVNDTFTSLARGQLGTTAASHAAGAEVTSFYRLQGNPLDLALKLMLSGWNGPYAEFIDVKGFNYINNAGSATIPNAVFFYNINLPEIYGVVEGDYITTSGSDFPGSNDVTSKRIESVTVTDEGTYLVIEGVTFVNELLPDTVLQIYASFRSQYDTLPDGLKMYPDEVDITEHERIRDMFMNGYAYDMYIRETIENAKEFIEQEIYSPVAAYSTARNARSSVAYTVGPLPTTTVVTLNANNVKNADRLVKKRGIGRNFYNTIIYRYDESALEEGKFLKGTLSVDATSKTTIPVGNRSMIISSKGLRSDSIISFVAARRLTRYAFGAEYFEGVRVLFADGYGIEPSDLVILDGVSLQIADRETGERASPPKYYEVIAKKIDIQTGDITLSLLDTQFELTFRYALISPASYIRTGLSQSSFQIQPSFASDLGPDEYQKWQEFGEITVRVRSLDYTTEATGVIDQFQGNTVYLKDPLGFTPSSGMVMELADYNDATVQLKLLYGFISNGSANFDDGKPPYLMV